MQCTVDEIEILEEDPVIGSRKIGDNRKRRLFGFDFFDPDDSSFESASSNAWSRKHRHDEAPKGRISERAVCQRGNRDAPAPPACPRAVIDLTLSSLEKEVNQEDPPRGSARNAGGVRNLDRDYKGSHLSLGQSRNLFFALDVDDSQQEKSHIVKHGHRKRFENTVRTETLRDKEFRPKESSEAKLPGGIIRGQKQQEAFTQLQCHLAECDRFL